jgi:hypothetical protein
MTTRKAHKAVKRISIERPALRYLDALADADSERQAVKDGGTTRPTNSAVASATNERLGKALALTK